MDCGKLQISIPSRLKERKKKTEEGNKNENVMKKQGQRRLHVDEEKEKNKE